MKKGKEYFNKDPFSRNVLGLYGILTKNIYPIVLGGIFKVLEKNNIIERLEEC